MADLFDAQTKDTIEQRMTQVFHTLARADKTAIEGTFARDMIDTNAVEFENSYAEMAMLRDAAFAETAWGEYLTLRAAEFGIERKQAVKAVGRVTGTGQSDGADEETDAALLERLLFRVRQPITSGNANHYRDWALSVDGVGNCKVIPLWNGNGTVKVIIVTAQNESASSELIETVYNYIESQRPIGATVTVVSPAPLVVNVSATVYGSADVDTVKDVLSDYFRQTGFSLNYVSLAQIGKLILGVEGIKDYKDLQLNGEAANVELTNEQLPVVGKVVLTLASE